MALHGDLKTFPFPDLLQWLDGARRPGRVAVTFGGGERFFYLAPGQVSRYGTAGLYERMARIARLLGWVDDSQARTALEAAASGARLEDAFGRVGVPAERLERIAREDLCQAAADLLEDKAGTFHFTEDPESEEDETAPVQIPLSEVIYEAARLLDEGANALSVIGEDTMTIFPGKPAGPAVAGLAQAALAAVRDGGTVGGVRLALGLSQVSAARILYDLFRSGYLKVDGAAPPKPDPLTHMLRQGERLLADGHYEAAALVFNSLLTADPSDRRVREFARAVEREHVEALYRRLQPMAVPKLAAPEHALGGLRPDERLVASLVNGKWDVSTLVLASPLRELQTLKAVQRMHELGLLQLRTQ